MTDKPHARSYRPDLPLSSVAQTYITYDKRTGKPNGAGATKSLEAWADSIVRKHNAEQTTRKPAPAKLPLQGYRPDLPTFGFSCEQLMRATKEDKAYWTAHPLTYDANGLAYAGYGQRCRKCQGKAVNRHDVRDERSLLKSSQEKPE